MYPKYEKYETFKPNLEKILNELKECGVIFGIVSNTSGERLDFFRKKLNLDSYFSAFVSRDDTPLRKPHGYPVFVALKQIKQNLKGPIDKTKVFLIGDLPTDIECANNAGIISIALLSGHLREIKEILEIDPFKKLLLD
jgi:HAD superfamily hydrolase (TIGR01549 family)